VVGKSEMEVVLKWCKRAGMTDSVPYLIRQVGKRLKGRNWSPDASLGQPIAGK
jgi:hypothetical protein